MKKVLIAADTYFPKKDGIVRFLEEVVQRISGSFDISLLVPNLGVSWKEHEEKITVSRRLHISGYPTMRFTFRNIKKIKEAVKKAETVFAQGPAIISILASYYGKRYKKRVIYYIHLIPWEISHQHLPRGMRRIGTAILKTIKKFIYNRADVLIVPYQGLIQNLEDLGIRTKKEVVRLGVDNKEFHAPENKSDVKRKLGIDPNITVIGYVGRISKEKNITVLLEAFERLKEEHNILLLIVGSGTIEIKSKEKVMMPGFVKDVVPYFQAMDIFVMPSLTETTSLATLEAMACGVPVVTTRVGFLTNYVKKDYNGLLFPKGNAHNLVLQLKKLLKNPEMLEKLGENARGTALAFSWDNTADRIKEILGKY